MTTKEHWNAYLSANPEIGWDLMRRTMAECGRFLEAMQTLLDTLDSGEHDGVGAEALLRSAMGILRTELARVNREVMR